MAPNTSTSRSNNNTTTINVKVVAAESLYKRDVFRQPDPFAVLTVDGSQTKTTITAKNIKSLLE